MTQSEEHRATLEAIRQNVGSFGYGHLLGMRVERIEEGTGAVSILVDTRLMHPQQIVHGGVIFTIADTAMSLSLISTLPANTPVSTIEAKINYIAPVVTGELIAEASIIHRGRSTAVMEASVYNVKDEEKILIARVMGTFHISKPRQA